MNLQIQKVVFDPESKQGMQFFRINISYNWGSMSFQYNYEELGHSHLLKI